MSMPTLIVCTVVSFFITMIGSVDALYAADGSEYNLTNIESKIIYYDSRVWPIDSKVISSTFGPRLKASDNYRYDFHRGIDFPAPTGTPVFASAEGQVFRVYYEGESGSPYPNGGNVVIMRHYSNKYFNFHGKSTKRYYTIYMHLDEIYVDKHTVGGPYVSLPMGSTIGTVGASGTTQYEHLHFEIRVGTLCSANAQRNGCRTIFDEPTDPHVSPLLLLRGRNKNDHTIEIESISPLRVLVTAYKKECDINELTVSSGSIVKTINFNTREGLDPDNADNAYYDGVEISPEKFNTRTKRYEIRFTFDDLYDFDFIQMTDVWGYGLEVTK